MSFGTSLSKVCIAVGLLSASSTALAADDFVLGTFRIDETRNPQSPLETIVTSVPKEVLVAGLGSLGVERTVAGLAVEAARAAAVSGRETDDVTQHYNAPNGYQLCAAHVAVYSNTNPARLSFIFDPTSNIAIGVRTPGNPWPGGRTWLKADVRVLWIRHDLAAQYRSNGVCFSGAVARPNERYQCGDVGRCQEFHLGGAFRVTAGPGNFVLRK